MGAAAPDHRSGSLLASEPHLPVILIGLWLSVGFATDGDPYDVESLYARMRATEVRSLLLGEFRSSTEMGGPGALVAPFRLAPGETNTLSRNSGRSCSRSDLDVVAGFPDSPSDASQA